MKTKDIVELLTPIHKINKICAVHFAAVGYFVKHNYLLPGKRLKRNAMLSKTPLNYFGFLLHCRSFKFKQKLIHAE